MKKFYFLAVLMTMAFGLDAQISACNDPSGGIQIAFDESMNCAAAPGDLAGKSEIGFHSGANMWSAVVEWNAAGATTAKNDGSDVFTVYIPDLDAYYATTSIENVFFVFNQGADTPDTPWDSEGKMDDGAGACADFSVVLADVTEDCAMTLSANDLRLDNEISVFPNPAADKATITIENTTLETFSISVTNMTGQSVRAMDAFNGTTYELNKGNLAAGIYFVKIQSESGKFATEKVVFN